MNTSSAQTFLEKAKTVHGITYDYTKMEYLGSLSKIKIICSQHGEFWQKPAYHLRGKGCQKCGNLKSTRPDGTEGLVKIFLEKVKKIHGDRYDYSKMQYNNCRSEIRITCHMHGDFLQKPTIHLKGSGCPDCGKIRSEAQEPPEEGETILKIPLRNKNKDIIDYALVDAADYALVKEYTWHRFESNSNFYAASKKNGATIKLHHLITKRTEETGMIDHINGRGLDNRKSNLRTATARQNSQNRKKKDESSSQYYGISFTKYNKWSASCCGKYLGSYDEEIDAAKAYDRFVIELLGPLAKTNGLISMNESNDNEGKLLEKSLKTKKLPVGIRPRGKKFSVIFKEKSHGVYDDFSQAVRKLKEVQQEQKQKDELAESAYRQSPVLRNQAGQAIIQTRDKNKNINAEFIVDEEKWHDLNKLTWTLDDMGYANNGVINKRLHQYVFGDVPPKHIVDHINQDRKDTRRYNLRAATRSGNSHNQTKREGLTSTYIGVHQRPSGRWRAQITKDGKVYSCGTHSTREDAAEARNDKAIELFGEFANLNIVESQN